jgi:hypothetical protein
MSDIQHLIDALVAFRDERDWAQFHDSKNLAAAIGIEAGELNELFLWKTIKESEGVDRERLKAAGPQAPAAQQKGFRSASHQAYEAKHQKAKLLYIKHKARAAERGT